jgi:peptidoglycan/LPS O-acetylase OafA/YrhL
MKAPEANASQDDRPLESGTARLNYLDWLRGLAVLLLIPFHAARVFDIWDPFYVKNAVTSRALSYGIVAFLNPWQLPLLFLLAGAASWLALRTRSGGQYATERTRRLLIPLLFGLLVIVPPQAYLVRFQGPEAFSGSYLSFLVDYFHVRGDQTGYTGLFTPAHLWFILFLFAFSLLALPLFLILKKRGRPIAWMADLCARSGTVGLLVLPLVPLWFAGALPALGGENAFFYITLFVYGFVLAADSRFAEALDKQKRLALTLGLVTMASVIALAASSIQPPKYSAGDILSYTLRTANTWLWCIALLGYGQRFLSFGNRTLRYVSEATYPFYLLHQTVIVIVAYFVIRWQAGVAVKYGVIAISSLAATLLVYDLLVKRVGILRVLLGMKPRAASRRLGLQRADKSAPAEPAASALESPVD